jgi:hypothetical protein
VSVGDCWQAQVSIGNVCGTSLSCHGIVIDGVEMGSDGDGDNEKKDQANNGHHHYHHTTPNRFHEQLLVGWKWEAGIGMMRSSRHEDDSHDDMDRGQ